MKHKINLYAAYKAHQTEKKAAGSGLVMFSVIIALGFVIAALGFRLTLDRNLLRDENTKLQAYIDNAIVSDTYETIVTLQEKTESIIKVVDIVEEGKALLQEKQHLTMEILDTFYKMLKPGVQIESSNFALPGVTLNVSYSDQKSIQEYIKSLEKLEIVQAVISEYVDNNDESLSTTLVITLRGSY